MRYVAYLGQRGTISASSLRPYLEGVRALFTDQGLPAPDQGTTLVTQAVRGLQAHQHDAAPPENERSPVPAWLIYDALQLAARLLPSGPAGARTRSRAASALVSRADLETARACLAVVVTFLFFHRPDYAVRIVARQLVVHDGGAGRGVELVHTPHGTKQDRLSTFADTTPRRYPAAQFATPHPRAAGLEGVDICDLLLRYAAVQGPPLQDPDRRFWALPGEDPARWSARTFDGWLQHVAASLSPPAVPPAGYKWTGHSLRKGAASAAAALGVPRHLIEHLGVWASGSRTLGLHYISPEVQPSAAAWFFFGGLAPGAAPLPG